MLLAGDQGRDYVRNTGDPIPVSMSLRGAFKGSSSRLYFVFHTENHKKKQSNAMAQMQRQTFSCSELTFYFICEVIL